MNGRGEGEVTASQHRESTEGSFSHLLNVHAAQLASLQSQLWAAHVRVVDRLEYQIRRLSQENGDLRSQQNTRGSYSDKFVLRSQSFHTGECHRQPELEPPWDLLPSGVSSAPSSRKHSKQSNGAPQPNGFSPLAWTADGFNETSSMDTHSLKRTLSSDMQSLPGQLGPPKEGPVLLPSLELQPSEPQKERDMPMKVPRVGSTSSLLTGQLTSALPVVSELDEAPKAKPKLNFKGKNSVCEVEIIHSDEEQENATESGNSDGSGTASDHGGKELDEQETVVSSPDYTRETGFRSMARRQDSEALWDIAPIWLTTTRPKLMRRSVTSDRSQMVQYKSDRSVRSGGSLFGERESNNSSDVASKPHFILQPSSPIVHIWEMFGLLLLLYDLAVVPLDLLGAGKTAFAVAMSWTVCIYWTLTVGVACSKGYIDEDGTTVLLRVKILRRYACTWLLPDLLALVFAWADLVVNCHGSGSTNLWVSELRLLRIVRLLRAPSVVGLTFERARNDRGVLLIGVFKIVTLIVGDAHLTACLWYFVGRLETNGDQGWVEREGLQNESLSHRYIMSFYWALAAFVGEVVHTPITTIEQGYTACVILMSFLISTSFVSSLTTSMTQLQIVSSQQSANMSALRQYLSENDVSRALSIKLMRNAQHALEEHRRRAHESSIELLRSISEPLLAELHFELRGRHLSNHPLLRRYIFINPSGVKKVCHVGCQFFTFAMGDTVFNEFDVPASPRMLFLIEGQLLYRYGKETETSRLTPGQWSCEGALWLASWTYLGTMSTHKESEVMSLDAQRFQRIVSTYPTAHLKVYSRVFVEYLKRLCDQRLLTDLCQDESELEHMVEEAFKTAEEEELTRTETSMISDVRRSVRSVNSHISSSSKKSAPAGRKTLGESTRQRTLSILNPSRGMQGAISLNPRASVFSTAKRWL